MKIGELGAATGTKTETIRFYEKIGLLPPAARLASNYRSYGEEHVQRLLFIRRARELGFSMDQVRELLSLADEEDRASDAIDRIARAHLDVVNGKMSELASLRAELERLIDECSRGSVRGSRIIDALADRGELGRRTGNEEASD